MRITNITLLLLALSALFLIGCKKDEPVDSLLTVQLQAEYPKDLSEFKLKEINVVAKEINTGLETKASSNQATFTMKLLSGLYDIQINGSASYYLDGELKESPITAYVERRQIVEGKLDVAFSLFLSRTDGGFLIEEIFFAGNNTPENELYLGDRYIKIYNNSDNVLYADGLAIAGTTFSTVERYEYKPNIMPEAVAVNAIMMIPGSGKEYPIQPGGSIIIAETAINHKEYNSKGLNLANADFEMLDPDDDEDVDNPKVTNMINFLDKLVIHNRGYQSFVLAKIPLNQHAFAQNHAYNYSYKFEFEGFRMDMEESTFKIPNSWIVDAVNLSVQSEFKWIVTAPSLDKGWTYCGKYDGDKSRFGRSVKRKVLSRSAKGYSILKDTNNSSVDFEAEASPSLIN